MNSLLLYLVVVPYVVCAYGIAGIASITHLRRARSPLVYAVWLALVATAPMSVPVALAVVALDSRRGR